MFVNKPEYQITPLDVPRLSRFAPMTEHQMELIVKTMKSKTCELDAIPTEILKTILPTVLPVITKLVNLSLGTGNFHFSWKTVTVTPLLKKIGLQLFNSNNRPESNLMFISNLIEKCMWSQIDNHCSKYDLQPDY